MVLKMISAGLASLVLCTLAAPYIINKLRVLKFGQQIITEYGPTWHKNKQGVPTMGGVLFIVSTVIAYLIFAFSYYSKGEDFYGGSLPSSAITTLIVAFLLAMMGLADDFTKIRKKHNEGLTEIQKLICQFVLGIGFVLYLGIRNHWDTTVALPFTDYRLDLWYFYYLFAFVCFVGFVNGTNITDGIDGLLTSVTIPVNIMFIVFAVTDGASDMAILNTAFLGGLIGFLFFNWNPARVFMGDTGSMFIGGMVVCTAFVLDVPYALFIAGFVYLFETFSVLIQRTYFKLTHGKRLFKMTPVHHGLELDGWPEKKIVFTFTAISAAACLICALGKYIEF